MPLLAKKISLVIGLTVCASMSHAGNCGSGYVTMVGYGDNVANNDFYFKLDRSFEGSEGGVPYFSDGDLRTPTQRIVQQPWSPSIGQQVKRESLVALLQTAFAGKLPVWVHSDLGDCSKVNAVRVFANESSLRESLSAGGR